MSILTQKQLSLAEIYSECTTFFENDKHHFLALLENHINIDDLIPRTFYRHYYASTGRPREFEILTVSFTYGNHRIPYH